MQQCKLAKDVISLLRHFKVKIHIIKTPLIIMYPQNQTNKKREKWGYPKYVTCDRVFFFLKEIISCL